MGGPFGLWSTGRRGCEAQGIGICLPELQMMRSLCEGIYLSATNEASPRLRLAAASWDELFLKRFQLWKCTAMRAAELGLSAKNAQNIFRMELT
eukprot:s8094_g2.t1